MSVVMSEFKPFPVCVNGGFATHYLLVKGHKTREENAFKPQDRTLFTINVPPYFSDVCMNRLFSSYGNVTNIYFHEKPTAGVPDDDSGVSKYFSKANEICGYKVAYVVFEKSSSLKKVLRCNDEVHSLSINENDICVGVRKWCRKYNSCLSDPKELSDEIEAFMASHDKNVEEQQKAKETDGVPDEEGWITVTKHSRKPIVQRTETLNKKITAKQKKKRSQKALLNFYSFQIRETKMEHLAKLRKKFQEDKEKIALMKANRKFKPY